MRDLTEVENTDWYNDLKALKLYTGRLNAMRTEIESIQSNNNPESMRKLLVVRIDKEICKILNPNYLPPTHRRDTIKQTPSINVGVSSIRDRMKQYVVDRVIGGEDLSVVTRPSVFNILTFQDKNEIKSIVRMKQLPEQIQEYFMSNPDATVRDAKQKFNVARMDDSDDISKMITQKHKQKQCASPRT